jgi:mutator protein MutT
MKPKKSVHVTAAILSKDGKYLITRRPEGSHLAGLWEFPGGKREARETLAMCLQREIQEELGMDIRVDQPVLTIGHEYEGFRVTLHFFKCTRLSGRPKALVGQEIRWVYPSELKKYAFPPPDAQIIEYLVSQDNDGF